MISLTVTVKQKQNGTDNFFLENRTFLYSMDGWNLHGLPNMIYAYWSTLPTLQLIIQQMSLHPSPSSLPPSPPPPLAHHHFSSSHP
jgi:hypothetical protein